MCSPSWQEGFYDSQISNQKAVPAGTVSLTPARFIISQGKEGSIVCCLPRLCLSLCHLPSGSLSPDLMPLRTDPWKHKETVKWLSKFLTRALLRPDPSSQWESTHWCYCALNQALMKSSPALPFSPTPAPITSCQIPNWTCTQGEQLSGVSECSAPSFKIARGELSYTHGWKPSGDEFLSHLLQLPHNHSSDQSKSMVLQSPPKTSFSPGPGSHGRWCFPM